MNKKWTVDFIDGDGINHSYRVQAQDQTEAIVKACELSKGLGYTLKAIEQSTIK